MKDSITINQLIVMSRGDKKSLGMIYNLVKRHPHFQGDRKKIYKKIIKFKKTEVR